MRLRKFTAIAALVLAVTILPAFQSVGGRIATSRTVCLKAGALTVGPISIPSSVPAKRLKLDIEIAGYGAPETAGIQFNGDTAANYTVFWSTTADGITWAAGTNKAAATDRIRIGPADTQQQRIVSATVFDNPAKTEHMLVFDSATGTGSTAQSTLDVGNAKWVSGTATAITSVQLVTTNGNMGNGSCLTASW